MKKEFLHALIFLFFGYTSCLAQVDTVKQAQTPPSIAKWSLKQCVDYALANSLNVQRSFYTVENSEVDLRAAKLSRLPTLNGSASYGSSWGRGLDPVSNGFVTQQINSANLGGNTSLPLFNGLRIHNNIKQNQRAYAASEQDLLKTKNDVILNVANLFINVVFNKELVENAKFKLASSQQQFDRTKKQVQAGALPKSEELNLDAQVAGNELTVVQQENSLALSILRLKQAMQMPASDPFDVDVPDLAPEDLVVDQTRDEIFDIAKQTMPEIRSSQLKIESSLYGIRAARGNLYPRLSLNGSINTNYSSISESEFYPDNTVAFSASPVGYVNQDINSPVFSLRPNGVFRDTYTFDQQIKDNVYRTLTFQLIIPIFNNYSARATLQRSIIQKEQAQINAKEMSNTLRQNVEMAFNDAASAAKMYNSSLRQVQAREEAFRMMNQRYIAGAATSFEFQVSQNDLYQAKTDLARAKYDFIFKKKVLDFYQGKPFEY